MVTRKKIEIPIFNYKLNIVIFDDWEEIKYDLPLEERDIEAKAITLEYHSRGTVLINSKRGSSIVHESGHIKNHIWSFIGYEPMRDNDEVDQYLVTYVYTKIVEVFYKHNNISYKDIMRGAK